MYSLIDFDSPDLKYTLRDGQYKEEAAAKLSMKQLLITDPDLTYSAVILNTEQSAMYSNPITIDDVRNNKVSMETTKNIRHYFLLGDRYEIIGKITKIAANYFKITGIMGTITILTKTIRLGQPYE